MMERRQFLKLSLTALAATSLSIQQLDWLLGAASGPEIIGITDFEKYVVSEINKMPEKQVGRIVRIESVISETNFSPVLRVLSVNKHFSGAKYYTAQYDPMSGIDVRNEFIKDMAMQLRKAFKP